MKISHRTIPRGIHTCSFKTKWHTVQYVKPFAFIECTFQPGGRFHQAGVWIRDVQQGFIHHEGLMSFKGTVVRFQWSECDAKCARNPGIIWRWGQLWLITPFHPSGCVYVAEDELKTPPKNNVYIFSFPFWILGSGGKTFSRHLSSSCWQPTVP